VLLDTATYVVSVVVVMTGLATLLAIVLGGDFILVKTLLFLFGWLVIGVATARMWPTSPEEVGPELATGNDSGRFQRVVDRVSPLRWIGPTLRPNQRLTQPTKLFASGVGTLVMSFLFEVGGIVA
jgi:hypothetical protein